MRSLCEFWTNEEGQDLCEYLLLVAVVSVAAAGIFSLNTPSLTTIWGSTNTLLQAAGVAVS